MLKQKYLIDFGSKFFLYFIGALTGIVVARVAGPEVVGTVAYGASFVGMFGFIIGLFGTSHIKLISEKQDLAKCNRIYTTLMIASSAVFMIVVTSYFFYQKYINHKEFSSTEQVVIFLSMGFTSLYGLTKVAEITWIGLGQQAKANIPGVIRSIVYQISRIIVVLLGFGAIALSFVNLLAAVITIPVYLVLLKNIPFKAKWDKELFKKYFAIGIPILIITVTNSFMENYGRIMLKDTSAVLELGIFTGGASLAMMLSMIGSSAGTIFFPLFSKASAEKNFDYIKKQIGKYERFLYLITLPSFFFLAIISDPLIPFIMGDEYIPSIPVFSILVFAAFLSISTMPYKNLIYGMGKFKSSAWVNLFSFILFIGLLYLYLSPRFLNLGAPGLALTLLSQNLIEYIFWYYYSKKQIQISISKSIYIISLINIVYFVSVYLLFNAYFQDMYAVLRMLLAGVFVLAFYGLLFLIKILTKKDIDFLVDVFNIKALINYTKDEMNK